MAIEYLYLSPIISYCACISLIIGMICLVWNDHVGHWYLLKWTVLCGMDVCNNYQLEPGVEWGCLPWQMSDMTHLSYHAKAMETIPTCCKLARLVLKLMSIKSFNSGTPAARMKKVPSAIVKKRSRELTAVFESFTPYNGMEGLEERIWITDVAADGIHLVRFLARFWFFCNFITSLVFLIATLLPNLPNPQLTMT